MTAFVEFYINQGANFNHVINLSDDMTNDYINVAGYTVSSQIRRSYQSENVSANISCSITNAAQGEITLSMDHHATSNLVPDRYVFDVLVIDTNDIASRVLEGYVTVMPGVTR